MSKNILGKRCRPEQVCCALLFLQVHAPRPFRQPSSPLPEFVLYFMRIYHWLVRKLCEILGDYFWLVRKLREIFENYSSRLQVASRGPSWPAVPPRGPLWVRGARRVIEHLKNVYT